MFNKLLVICGPTASGKSYLGHYLANIYDGEIINADSMQIYQEIPIITASPSKIYQQTIPYHLYNFISIDQEFSVIKYVNYALEKITEITNKGKLPIIVGGTGLYINSLIFGYNNIPAISDDLRQYARTLHINIGQSEFFNKLIQLDQLAQRNINQSDSQRSIRAYEVFIQTGQSIFTFQAQENINMIEKFDSKIIFLHPKRELLYQACNDRLEKLFSEGAIEEIYNITKNFDPLDTAKIKAIGVQQIISYLNNQITLQTAIELAKAKTKQYAKRQITWFKNQIKDKVTLEYDSNQQFEQLIKELFLEQFS